MSGLPFLLLHVVVLGGWAVLVVRDGPDASERRARLAWIALTAATFAGVLLAVPVGAIPTDWLTPVREGGTEIQLRIARGEGGDVGALFARGYLGALARHPASAEAVARVQLAAVLAAAVALLAVGRRVLGSWVAAAVFTGAFVTSVPVRMAAFGSGAGPVAWLWLIAGGVALHGLSVAGTRAAVAAWGAAVVGTSGLLAFTRPELLLLPGVGVVAVALARAGMWARAGAWVSAHRVATLAGVALILAASWAGYDAWAAQVRGGDHWGWALQALHPLDPSGLALPRVLVSMWPLGVAVLALVGALRSPGTNLGLGVGVLALLRVDHAAAHGSMTGTGIVAHPLELLRYVSLVAPALLALAWLGWLRLPARARAIALVWVLIPALPGAWTMRYRAEDRGPMWSAWGRVDNDAVREVRFVAQALRDHPGCALVAPVAPVTDSSADWMVLRSGWPDAGGRELAIHKLHRADLDTAVAQADAACVLLYLGTDCARARGPTCDAWGVALEQVALSSFSALPHAHPSHGWDTREVVDLRLFRAR